MSGSPGATVLAADPPKPPESKRVPGWKQLKTLLPYIARSKGQVAVGMVTLAAMGVVGTLQPLAFGVIMDCLSGNPQPLGRLSQMSPRLTRLLIPAYAPSSVRTLVIYCCGGSGHRRAQGGLLVLDALDSDRPLARYRIRSSQRFAGSPADHGAGVLCAQSHRRTDVARHQRPERRAHGSGSRNHVQRNRRSSPWCWPSC